MTIWLNELYSYEDLVKNHKVTYVAGGASQNAARGAAVSPSLRSADQRNFNASTSQYVLPPKSVVYTGCVGKDELAEQLKAANKREGLDEVYQVKEGEKTGACAVVITGHHRYIFYHVVKKPTRGLIHRIFIQITCHYTPRGGEVRQVAS